MSDIIPRIAARVALLPGGWAELSRRIGEKPQTVNNWKARGRVPASKLPLLAAVLGVSNDWLLTGNNPLPTTSPSPVNARPTAPLEGRDVTLWEAPEDLPSEHYTLVDSYAVELSAGAGAEALQWQPDSDPLAFRADWFARKQLKPEQCKGLFVRGHSMSPALEDGDVVLIDLSDTWIRDGEIYAILLNGELLIKRLEKLHEGVRIRSDNPHPQYQPPRELSGSEMEGFRVLGRKVWRAG